MDYHWVLLCDHIGDSVSQSIVLEIKKNWEKKEKNKPIRNIFRFYCVIIDRSIYLQSTSFFDIYYYFVHWNSSNHIFSMPSFFIRLLLLLSFSSRNDVQTWNFALTHIFVWQGQTIKIYLKRWFFFAFFFCVIFHSFLFQR